MSKLGKKISAILLAAAVAVSAVTPAFAAGSPTSGKEDSDTKVTAKTGNDTKVTGSKTATCNITNVSSEGKNLTIPSSIKSDGTTYKVNSVCTGAVKGKYDKITLILNSRTHVKPQIMKSKKSKKTKKVVIKADSGIKLKASQFNKEAFKGFKNKIVVKKSSMSKEEFKKLVKKLRKGGFKGKIVYKK